MTTTYVQRRVIHKLQRTYVIKLRSLDDSNVCEKWSFCEDQQNTVNQREFYSCDKNSFSLFFLFFFQTTNILLSNRY